MYLAELQPSGDKFVLKKMFAGVRAAPSTAAAAAAARRPVRLCARQHSHPLSPLLLLLPPRRTPRTLRS